MRTLALVITLLVTFKAYGDHILDRGAGYLGAPFLNHGELPSDTSWRYDLNGGQQLEFEFDNLTDEKKTRVF